MLNHAEQGLHDTALPRARAAHDADALTGPHGKADAHEDQRQVLVVSQLQPLHFNGPGARPAWRWSVVRDDGRCLDGDGLAIVVQPLHRVHGILRLCKLAHTPIQDPGDGQGVREGQAK